jgi:hypothetical protein
LLKKFTSVLGIVLLLALFLSILTSTVLADQSEAASAISDTKSQLVECYNAAKETEAGGANITTLTRTLNEAGSLLSSAEYAFSNGDFAGAKDFAVQSQSKLVDFVSSANALYIDARVGPQRDQDILIDTLSICGTFAVLIGSWGLWSFLKKKYENEGGQAIGYTAE